MKKVVIFDIDGTLADIRHRRPLLNNQKPNWQAFNAAMGDDLPNRPIVDLYRTLWDSDKYNLVLVSGRSDDHRYITEQWLTWNLIPFSTLLMRKSGDFRPDVDIKQELLNKIRTEIGEILFTVDDRQAVVDMWRRNGITCLQCDIGNF
jgi:hypothetical protein